jgi:hypothetical protein
MVQEFPRRIDGYNRPFFVPASGNLARGAAVVANAPTGPGRIETFWVSVVDTGDFSTNNNSLALTMDGVSYGITFGLIFPKYTKSPWIGPATAAKIGTSDTAFECKLPLDYESSASISCTNSSSPDPTWFYLTIFGRSGR